MLRYRPRLVHLHTYLMLRYRPRLLMLRYRWVCVGWGGVGEERSMALAHIPDATLPTSSRALAHIPDATLPTSSLALAHIPDATLQMGLCGLGWGGLRTFNGTSTRT